MGLVLVVGALAFVGCNTNPSNNTNPDIQDGLNYLADLKPVGDANEARIQTTSSTVAQNNIAGRTYVKQTTVLTPSTLRYNLAGQCNTLSTDFGLAGQQTNNQAKFQIYADNRLVFQSINVKPRHGNIPVPVVHIEGAKELRLVTQGGSDGKANIPVAWGSANVQCKTQNKTFAPQSPVTPPDGIETDTTPPSFVSVYPWGAGASVYSYVSIAFSEIVDPSTFTITTTPNIPVLRTEWWNGGRFVRVVPANNLPPNTTYTVQVSVKDWAGNTLAGWSNWKFTSDATTSDPNDNVRPQVDSVIPWGQGFDVTSLVGVDFTEAMNPATFEYSVAPSITNASVVWNDARNYATIVPEDPLQNETTYTVTVRGKDLAGNPLLGSSANNMLDYHWQFGTNNIPPPIGKAPRIKSVVPWGTNINPNTSIALAFDEAIARETLTVTITPPVALAAPRWASNNQWVSLQPNTPLVPGTTYTVAVNAKDNDGNPLAGSTKWTFATTATLRLGSTTPTTTINTNNTQITVTGAGFSNQTAFFMQSNKLEVIAQTENTATLTIPSGFLPSTYGLMAVNPDGARATLYPAFAVQAGPNAPLLNPKAIPYSFVDGVVINHNTKRAIRNATASIPGATATTDKNGYYYFRGVPQGRHMVRIEADGYEPTYRIAEVNGTDQTVRLRGASLEPRTAQSTTIGATGGTHYATAQGANGPHLVIPPGALDQDVPIQFTHLRGAETLPELPEAGKYLAFAHLEPSGLVFKKPATLYLPLQPGIRIPNGTKINIFYFDVRQGKWVDDITTGVISEQNGQQFLEYEINHFTWIGGVMPVAIPNPGGTPDPIPNPMPTTWKIKYGNGRPAVGLTTTFGITDANGEVNGTIAASRQKYTTRAYIYGTPGQEDCNGGVHPGRKAQSLSYNACDPIYSEAEYDPQYSNVTFPPITLPTVSPNFNISIYVANSCATSGGNRQASTQSTTGLTQITENGALVLAKDIVMLEATYTERFTTGEYNLSPSYVFPNKIRISAGGGILNGNADFVNLDPFAIDDRYRMQAAFTSPVKAKAGQEFTLSVTNMWDETITKTLKVDVAAAMTLPEGAASLSVPDRLIPTDAKTPLFVDQGDYIFNLFRQSDTLSDAAISDLDFDFPIKAVDENGEVLPVSPSSPITIDTSGWETGVTSSGTVPMQNGVAKIPYKISSLKTYKMPVTKAFTSAPASCYALESAKTPKPKRGNPLLEPGPRDIGDEAGWVLLRHFLTARGGPLRLIDDPNWQDYMKRSGPLRARAQEAQIDLAARIQKGSLPPNGTYTTLVNLPGPNRYPVEFDCPRASCSFLDGWNAIHGLNEDAGLSKITIQYESRKNPDGSVSVVIIGATYDLLDIIDLNCTLQNTEDCFRVLGNALLSASTKGVLEGHSYHLEIKWTDKGAQFTFFPPPPEGGKIQPTPPTVLQYPMANYP